MKKNSKFMIAVFGMTIAVLGSISNVNAKVAINDNVTCNAKNTIKCGETPYPECKEIVGKE